MPRCSFCKKNYEFPYGLTLVLNDGSLMYFCSSKCRKNQLHLKRDNKKVNWIRKAGVNEAVEAFEINAKSVVKEDQKEKTSEKK